MSLLEKILGKLLGEDKMHATEMMAVAIQTKVQRAPGHVWADYMFLAACYGAAASDEKLVRHTVEQIRQGFPNYDPSTRFSWKSVGIGDLAGEDLQEGDTRFDTLRYRAPVIGRMNQFCERHPEFSFGDALGKYFPSALRMGIKKDTSSGLVKEEDGKYKLNQALDE